MAYWAVVRAVPQHDRLAVETVCLAGYETFTPKIRTRIGVQWHTVPLFSGYFFARVQDHWRAIERAMGVLTVVKFGPAPARLPDEEIAGLIARSDADGIIRLSARPASTRRVFTPGDAVTITGGPFRGLNGLYSGMTTQERELILLNILGRETQVEIAAALIAPSQ